MYSRWDREAAKKAYLESKYGPGSVFAYNRPLPRGETKAEQEARHRAWEEGMAWDQVSRDTPKSLQQAFVRGELTLEDLEDRLEQMRRRAPGKLMPKLESLFPEPLVQRRPALHYLAVVPATVALIVLSVLVAAYVAGRLLGLIF